MGGMPPRLVLFTMLVLPSVVGSDVASFTGVFNVAPGGRVIISPGGRLVIGGDDGLTPAEVTFLSKVGMTVEELYADEMLDFASSGLNDADCVALAGLLSKGGSTVNATTLDLSDNDVGDTSANALASAFSAGALPNLLVLDLTDTNIGSDGIQAIADAPYDGTTSSRRHLSEGTEERVRSRKKLPAYEKLRELKFRSRVLPANMTVFENRTFDASLDAIIDGDAEADDISEVRRNATRGVVKLMERLGEGCFPSLSELSLSDLGLTDEVPRAFRRACSRKRRDVRSTAIAIANEDNAESNASLCASLERLELPSNELTDDGVEELSLAMFPEEDDTELGSESDNDVGEVGTPGFPSDGQVTRGGMRKRPEKRCDPEGEDVLKFGSVLRHLKLDYNQIGDRGARALANGLKCASELQSLGLRANNITDPEPLAEALENITNLEEVVITPKDPRRCVRHKSIFYQRMTRHRANLRGQSLAGLSLDLGPACSRGSGDEDGDDDAITTPGAPSFCRYISEQRIVCVHWKYDGEWRKKYCKRTVTKETRRVLCGEEPTERPMTKPFLPQPLLPQLPRPRSEPEPEPSRPTRPTGPASGSLPSGNSRPVGSDKYTNPSNYKFCNHAPNKSRRECRDPQEEAYCRYQLNKYSRSCRPGTPEFCSLTRNANDRACNNKARRSSGRSPSVTMPGFSTGRDS